MLAGKFAKIDRNHRGERFSRRASFTAFRIKRLEQPMPHLTPGPGDQDRGVPTGTARG